MPPIFFPLLTPQPKKSFSVDRYLLDRSREKFSSLSSVLPSDRSFNGSSSKVVPVLKVDRTGLAGGCGHYTDVSRPPRTPLFDISNYSCLSREQEYLGGSRLKATLQAPNVVTDENGQFRSKVRRCNKDRRALRPLTINLENVVDFDDDVPLSDVLSGLRTDRVRLKTLKRKGTFVVDEIKKKLNFGPAISELPPHNVVGYEDIENSTILGHDYNDEIFFSDDESDDEYSQHCQDLKSRYDKNFAQVPKSYASLGPPTARCQKCHAVMWKEERVNKNSIHGIPKFNLQ
ncbi:hypothetical protein ACET3Z_018294 [Daucus carota]